MRRLLRAAPGPGHPRRPRPSRSWVSQRFGWRLFGIFFRSYTEKVWGVPASEMPADWAAQRIRGLSLWRPRSARSCPKRGRTRGHAADRGVPLPAASDPVMMWERPASGDRAAGARSPPAPGHPHRARGPPARPRSWPRRRGRGQHTCEAVISSMPLAHPRRVDGPPSRPTCVDAAAGLRYRDFLTVALVLDGDEPAFPDNWIYVHRAGGALGRIQNFRAWCRTMVTERPHLPRAWSTSSTSGRRVLDVSDDDPLVRPGQAGARDDRARPAPRARSAPATSCGCPGAPTRSTTATYCRATS